MRTLFRGARIIDGLGGMIERGKVLVEDRHIVYAGPEGGNRERADRVYELDGRTLLPGIIDTHAHFAGGDYDPAHEDDSLAMAVLRTVPTVKRVLLAGITTVRTAGSRDHIDLDIRDAIRQGVIVGPRVIASGRGITMTGGHLHEIAVEVDGVDEVRREVRSQIKRGVDSIKILALSGGVSTANQDVQAEQFTLEEVLAAVYEAHKAGKTVLGHAIGQQGIMNGIQAGIDSIDHGIFLTEEACGLMKQKRIFYVPTFGPFYYYTERRLAEPWRIERAEAIKERHIQSFVLALEKGLTLAMGSDCGFASRFPNGENALEIELMVRHGMEPMDAIVATTGNAARLLRLDTLLGSVTVGKLADLIVVNTNPIDDPGALRHQVALVMKDGTVYLDRIH
ncbi:MAG: amidohydrolase family protein [Ardenticatenaceae bacterium]|nr:amidohydrolase family protein [Ardenticatenaceae bacterium]HBY93920.1 amidohydrolase family protein [Chloroflexota bacterium]